MEATALRIGNYVWDDYSGEMIVTGISKPNGLKETLSLKKQNKLPEGSFLCETIQPIPLNEGWLLKFGFTLKDRINGGYLIKIQPYLEDYLYCSKKGCIALYSEILKDSPKDFIINKRCKYVHQLQNFYFELTGEELIYKY